MVYRATSSNLLAAASSHLTLLPFYLLGQELVVRRDCRFVQNVFCPHYLALTLSRLLLLCRHYRNTLQRATHVPILVKPLRQDAQRFAQLRRAPFMVIDLQLVVECAVPRSIGPLKRRVAKLPSLIKKLSVRTAFTIADIKNSDLPKATSDLRAE